MTTSVWSTTTLYTPRPVHRLLCLTFNNNSYYRHFTLYKHIFTTKVNVVIEQRHPHGVEEPPLAPPLGGALMMINVSQSEGS